MVSVFRNLYKVYRLILKLSRGDMMRKSLVFLMVLMVMSVVLFAGCLGNDKNQVSEVQQQTKEVTNEQSTVTAPVQQESPITEIPAAIDDLNVESEDPVSQSIEDIDVNPNVF